MCSSHPLRIRIVLERVSASINLYEDRERAVIIDTCSERKYEQKHVQNHVRVGSTHVTGQNINPNSTEFRRFHFTVP
jgi:hypothetical protein